MRNDPIPNEWFEKHIHIINPDPASQANYGFVLHKVMATADYWHL
ncbi:MAG: hypothetical protein V4445_09950 [Pseudomonadota bacterium]